MHILRVIRLMVVLAGVIALAESQLHAVELKRVHFAEKVFIEKQPLALQGVALLRWLGLIDVYVAAYYAPPGADGHDPLADMPKRLDIGYLVSIDGAEFSKAAQVILERNLTPEMMTRLQPKFDRIAAAYRDVKPEDRYTLTYLPGAGTELRLNDTLLTVIEGADFAAAYFGIWLGKDPIDQAMRRQLLAGSHQ